MYRTGLGKQPHKWLVSPPPWKLEMFTMVATLRETRKHSDWPSLEKIAPHLHKVTVFTVYSILQSLWHWASFSNAVKKNLRKNFFWIGFRKTFGIHESFLIRDLFVRLSELEIAFRLDITCVPVAFLIVSILTAHVTAVVCPYKGLSGRICMQIQEHENSYRGAQLRKLLLHRNTFSSIHEFGGCLLLTLFFRSP